MDKQDTATRYDDLPELLSPVEFAAAARVGRSVVYDMARSGRLASKKFGRLLRIPKSELRIATEPSR